MRRNQLDVKRSRLWVARLKGSLSVEHPIAGDELRAIKRYLASREDNLPWLFVSERGAQLTRQAVNYIVRLAGEKAKLGRVWPHMLRHSLTFVTFQLGVKNGGYLGLCPCLPTGQLDTDERTLTLAPFKIWLCCITRQPTPASLAHVG